MNLNLLAFCSCALRYFNLWTFMLVASREIKNKQNITFSKNKELVGYEEPKFYVFEQDLSAGSENDSFTLLNFPILVRFLFLTTVLIVFILHNGKIEAVR